MVDVVTIRDRNGRLHFLNPDNWITKKIIAREKFD